MIAAPPRQIALPYPHAGQRMVQSEARRFNWLAAGRRWRKTTLVMALCVQSALARKRIVWGAPVYDQVRIGWEETRRAAGGAADFNQARMQVTFPGGGTILYRSLDDPDNARGHTADRVVIDECGDVRAEAWYEVLRPMLIDTGGDSWAIGSPRGLNWFWKEHQRARTLEDSMCWQVPTVGAEIMGGQLIRQPHPLENPAIPFAEIVNLFHTMPEADFRQEILSEFVESGYTVFSPTWWDGQNRYDATDPVPVRRCIARYISWDTALKDKNTSDYAACTVAEMLPDYSLLIREVWRDRLSFPNLTASIEAKAREYNADGKLKAVLIEDKVSGTSAYQTLTSVTADPWLASILVPFPPTGSKRQRASQAGVWCRNGSVKLPHPGPAWLPSFEEELFGFTGTDADEHDDQVDSLSQLLIWLERYLSEGYHARAEHAERKAREVDLGMVV